MGVVFSASDFRHPVTTPAMLIMGQILLKVEESSRTFIPLVGQSIVPQSSVKTVGDLVLGLTVCHIFTTLVSVGVSLGCHIAGESLSRLVVHIILETARSRAGQLPDQLHESHLHTPHP